MKKITNKNVALLVIGFWGIFFLFGFIEGFMGYPAGVTLLPAFVDSIIGLIGAISMIYALYRLYKSPDSTDVSE